MKTRNQLSVNQATQEKSPSPINGAKRSSTGPTRILPRRSCGRPNSLLASNQPQQGNSIACSKAKSPLKINGKTGEDSILKREDTQKHSISLLKRVTCEPGSSMLANKETDDSKDLSVDVPSTSAESIANNEQISNSCGFLGQTKQLVRISLPSNSVKEKSSSSINPTQLNKSVNELSYIMTDNEQNLDEISDSSNEKISDDNVVINQRLEHEIAQNSSKLSNANISEKKIFNVLIGVTGSVATIKLIELVKKLKSMFPRPYTNKFNGPTTEAFVKIKIVMTKNSLHFAPKDDLVKSLDDISIEIYDDSDEWSQWKKIGDPVLHIELRKWADLCLIAPLDANTMAKLATGICDNLLTCVARAWDTSKPLVYCPAMNVHMYNHPITKEHLCRLQSFGYLRVDCVEKRLACGDFGLGGMAPVESISNKVVDALIQPPATRKVSLTRPLLNQQPTYPIISMADDNQGPGQNQSIRRFSSSISDQILNRFRSNNQITIHPVLNNNRMPNQTLDGCVTSQGESLLKRQQNNHGGCYVGDEHSNSRNYITMSPNGKRNSGSVTSVQNLQAIGLDHNLNDMPKSSVLDEDMEMCFDPSNLLEQSMTTDDSSTILIHDRISNASLRNLTDHSLTRGSSGSIFGEGGSATVRINSQSPIFNTSKFLALCFNKERGCFTCTICKHDYKNRKSMARHLKEQHVQGNIYHCKECGVSYKRREKLIKHNRERHLVHELDD